MKTSINKLKNGLTIICVEDQEKNQTFAELIVKYGSIIKNVKIDGKEFMIKPGLAHLLEHALIEGSLIGNLMTHFHDNNVYFNGVTFRNKTSFPLRTVEDFYSYLKVLLTNINKISLSEDKLNEIKKPVIDEIIRSKDRGFYKFNTTVNKYIFNKTHFEGNLGEEDIVNSITVDELALVHDAFYQPSNQILIVSGNVDEKKLCEFVSEIYDELNIKKIDVELLDELDDEQLNDNLINIKDNQYDELASIYYKVDISQFKKIDRLKLDYYFSLYIDYYYSSTSECYKKIRDNKISLYSMDAGNYYLNENIMAFYLNLITNKHQEYFSLLDEVKNKIEVDEEYFELWKKRNIMNIIRRNLFHEKILNSLSENILLFDLYYNEDIKFIEDLNYEEYKEFMNKLDFSNEIRIIQKKDK